MNNVARTGWTGFVICIALAGAGFLTGCEVYVQPVGPRVVYAPPPPPAPAERPVIVVQANSDFYDPLTAYGRWVTAGPYGLCWCPNEVEAGWRPYCVGHWESTDAGWYWVSDEPWGWATYHYGRWGYDPNYGWLWVPGTQWAPAWVVWREGGGYCGWAPLGVSVGVEIAPAAFVFVGEGHFLDPVRPTTVVIDVTLVSKTVSIIKTGPRTEVIERATGRQIHTVSAKQLRHNQETATAAKQPQLRALHHAQPPKRAPGQAAREEERKAAAPKQKPEGAQGQAAKEEERKAAAPKQKQEEKRQTEKKEAAEKKRPKEEAEKKKPKGEEERRGKEEQP